MNTKEPYLLKKEGKLRKMAFHSLKVITDNMIYSSIFFKGKLKEETQGFNEEIIRQN